MRLQGRFALTSKKTCLAWLTAKKSALLTFGHQTKRLTRLLQKHVKPEQFRQIYIPMLTLDRSEKADSPLYNWRPQSTYIRRPPLLGRRAGGRTHLKGMRPLAILPDNITTDHLSPSMRFWQARQQANTWQKWACPKKTLTAMRPTAATI